MFVAHLKSIKIAFISLVLFTFLTGFVYPLVVTGVAQWLFPWRANGSLIDQAGHVRGSQLIGQLFTDPKYFWGRPSSTSNFPYNAASSGASNWGPSNPAFLTAMKERVKMWQASDLKNKAPVPVELIMASGSGLDPHISPSAAYYQVSRIAKARGISEKQIQQLIEAITQKKTMFILGEPRVNVLELNLVLDNLNRDNLK